MLFCEIFWNFFRIQYIAVFEYRINIIDQRPRPSGYAKPKPAPYRPRKSVYLRKSGRLPDCTNMLAQSNPHDVIEADIKKRKHLV